MDLRKARSRQAVLAAATAVLAEGGIRSFSVDAVAARSGVAKTTIYRQWPTRGDLLCDVYVALDTHTGTPVTGSLRGDLTVLLHDLADDLKTADWARNLTAVVAEGEHDRDIAKAHAIHVKVETQAVREVIEHAITRGEAAPELDVDLAVEYVVGALFYRRLVVHGQTRKPEVDLLIDLVVSGLTASASNPQSKDRR